MRDSLQKRIPEFEILIGGKTSIDVTKKGVNKAYGVTWFANILSIPPQDMLYVGDALYPGGNDEVVIQTGVQTIQVESVEETGVIIDKLCSLCAAS
jgi:hydroxymethylpyrimidine pyrophosphatase-like HAD family hydrolase